MLIALKRMINKAALLGAERVCRREFARRKFTRLNQNAVEYAYLFRQIAARCPITVLDVGTGMSSLPQLMSNAGCVVTAVDNRVDYWPAGMVNRHYHIIDDDITKTRLTEQFDMVTCICMLQHVQKHNEAMECMARLIKPGGHLVVTIAYTDRKYYPNVYKLPGSAYGQNAPYACQSFSRAELDGWVRATGLTVADQEYYQFWTGDFWTHGEQVLPSKCVAADERHQYTCFVLKKKPA